LSASDMEFKERNQLTLHGNGCSPISDDRMNTDRSLRVTGQSCCSQIYFNSLMIKILIDK
jgi:hypothetical protein